MFKFRQDDGAAPWRRRYCACMLGLLVCSLSMCATFNLTTSQSLGAEKTPNAVVEKSRPEALVVVIGARNVQFFAGANEGLGVAYLLTDEYPARKTRGQISSRLRKLGWVPLKRNWLNPELPSSHEAGWQDFPDPMGKPPRYVYQWGAQWQDATGNLVAYSLRYEYPLGGPRDLHTLSVNGAWFPAASVKRMQRDTAKEREEQRKKRGELGSDRD